MRAEIVRFFSPDADPLITFSPADPARFALWVEMMARPEGTSGEEAFGLVVCTPQWYRDEYHREAVPSQAPEGAIFRDFCLVIEKYDWPRIRDLLERRISGIEGTSWREVAEKISEFARWEFAGMLGPEN